MEILNLSTLLIPVLDTARSTFVKLKHCNCSVLSVDKQIIYNLLNIHLPKSDKNALRDAKGSLEVKCSQRVLCSFDLKQFEFSRKVHQQFVI
jgi:hypothetical protein